MPTVSVCAPAAEERYDIVIERGLLRRAAPLLGAYAGRRAAVVADEHTATLYGRALLCALRKAGAEATLLTLPAGETTKSAEQLFALYDAFLAAGLTRADAVFALGGGVIGDLAGYAACTYLRGVDFIQVPTTLLAQVDSSVGGKVAVNHPRGKNLLGAFYQPRLVLIDPNTLSTLDERQFGAGLGEVVKCGCIADSALFELLESLGSRKALVPHLPEIVARCCALKARYVREDPHDHGVRMQLNFGHTLGHALENALGYGRMLHGEGVCIGMAAAARWGERKGVTPPGTAKRLVALLDAYGLPSALPQGLSPEQLAETMALDKKAEGRTVRAVLLNRIGACDVFPMTARELVDLTFERA